MSRTPTGGHPQGWDCKLVERTSLPPAPGEEWPAHTKHGTDYHKSGGRCARETTEGSSGSSARSGRASPACVRWARALPELLEDAEGVRLFRKYVADAGPLHCDRLNFYFAVRGLRRETDPAKIRHIVNALCRFLRKSLLAVPQDLMHQIKQSLKDGSHINNNVFDKMDQEVTQAITESTYQSFLRSEAYVSYVSAAMQPLSSSDGTPSPPAHAHLAEHTSSGALATLHEEVEMPTGSAPPAPTSARLTHDALLATQSRRLHSDMAPHRKRWVYSAHASYAGYCPASRYDSERASLSSGRTDSDAVSLASSSLDGVCVSGAREVRRGRVPGLDRHAVINRDVDTSMVIPRTARMQAEQLRVLPPEEFAPLLIERLERVRREREARDRLDRRLDRLADADGEEALPPQLVVAAIREKLQLDDDNDQDILDQHVSRVWSERTPGASPPGGRRGGRGARRAPSATSADSGHYDDPRHHHHSLTRRCGRKTGAALTDSGVSVLSGGSEGAGPLAARSASLERRRDRAPRLRGAEMARGGPAPTHTVVMVGFLEQRVPYMLRVPGSPITLRAFKDYLPKKGNYRYFFKTQCADLDNAVIQEEICNDNDILPTFEGKVMARVKSIE